VTTIGAYLNVTDRQTDGRTNCRSNNALCVTSRRKTNSTLSLNQIVGDGFERWLHISSLL